MASQSIPRIGYNVTAGLFHKFPSCVGLCGKVQALQSENEGLKHIIAQQQAELALKNAIITELQGQIRNLRADLFAPSSEKRRPAPKEDVVIDVVGAVKKEEEKPHHQENSPEGQRKRGAQVGHKGNGRKIPQGIPTVEVMHEIPPEAKVCPKCGLPYRDLSITEDSTEVDCELRVVVKIHKRRKAAQICQCEGVPTIITAPKPPQVIPKSKFSNGFWAMMLVIKYYLQTPINRQILQWKMYGLDVSAGTLAGGFKELMVLLEPLYNRLIEISRTEEHWHADETRWLVFTDTPDKKGFNWWLWVFVSKLVTVFVLDSSRSSKVPENYFGPDARGILNVDRYLGYRPLDGQIQRALCWYHVRRDFIRAQEAFPALAEWAESWLTEIHTLEERNEARLAVLEDPLARESAQAALEEQVQHMAEKRDQELKMQDLLPRQRTILDSLKRNWDGLVVFMGNPHVPMHNNVAEQALRSPAVGRKNYYGHYAEWSGKFAAMCMSILQTAARHGVNPIAYLDYYFDSCAKLGKGKTPENIDEYLPWAIPEEVIEAYNLRMKKGDSS